MNSSESNSLDFNIKAGELSKKTRVTSNRIAWLKTLADKPGASFDLTIKDAVGRVRFERHFQSDNSTIAGEQINLATLVGEEVEVILDNVKSVDMLKVALN